MAVKELDYKYVCPFCKGHLRLSDDIIFLTKTKNGESGLVLLSPRLGDYNVIVDPQLQYAPGDHVNFICPICYENLDASDFGENLAKVIMIDKAGQESEIFFSKIVGEKCTYKIEGGKVEYFGEDANTYRNFFGEAPSY